jgi:death-on-curing protein
MAAAYLFHITRDHPFVDGNKRAGLAAALVFLGLNGKHVQADDGELAELLLGVAGGRVSKAEVAVFFQRNTRK